MGTYYNPRIVTDGLVLALDAANRKSYPGTGNTWIDLCGSGNNGTLSNGASYSQDAIQFDGVDNFVGLNAISVPTNITLSIWVNKTNALPVPFAPLIEQGGTRRFRFIMYNNKICFGNDTVTDNFYVTNNNVSTLNLWYNYVAVYDGSYKIFVNGKSENTSANTGAYASWGTNSLNIGYRPYTASVASFYGLISSVQIYNRALSEQEIKQNFNAIRGRYGV